MDRAEPLETTLTHAAKVKESCSVLTPNEFSEFPMSMVLDPFSITIAGVTLDGETMPQGERTFSFTASAEDLGCEIEIVRGLLNLGTTPIMVDFELDTDCFLRF